MNKNTITQVLLVLLVILAALFGGKKYLELENLSETITTFQQEQQQLKDLADSLQVVNNDQMEIIQSLQVDNDQIKQLNRQLSQLAAQRQKVKYVTSSAHLQVFKDSLNSVFNSLLYQRLTADSLREQLQIAHLSYEEQRDTLFERLFRCESSKVQFPFSFEKEDDYASFSITVFSPDSATIDFWTRDTLNFAHTTSRSWFLGKKQYSVFAESKSPYSITKTHSYVFKNKGLLKTKE